MASVVAASSSRRAAAACSVGDGSRSPRSSLLGKGVSAATSASFRLLSEAALRDPFVGVVKAAVIARYRHATFVDLTHDIEPGLVADAAFWLAQAYPWFPPGTVHLAVVDPGVGTNRAALVAKAGEHVFVGPDNGLFEVV